MTKENQILELIKEKRELLDFSQREMGIHLGYVDGQTYMKLESGKKQLTLEQLISICAKLSLELEVTDNG